MHTVTHSVVQRQHGDASGRSHRTALAAEDTGMGARGRGRAGMGLGGQAALSVPACAHLAREKLVGEGLWLGWGVCWGGTEPLGARIWLG